MRQNTTTPPSRECCSLAAQRHNTSSSVLFLGYTTLQHMYLGSVASLQHNATTPPSREYCSHAAKQHTLWITFTRQANAPVGSPLPSRVGRHNLAVHSSNIPWKRKVNLCPFISTLLWWIIWQLVGVCFPPVFLPLIPSPNHRLPSLPLPLYTAYVALHSTFLSTPFSPLSFCPNQLFLSMSFVHLNFPYPFLLPLSHSNPHPSLLTLLFHFSLDSPTSLASPCFTWLLTFLVPNRPFALL